MTELLSKKVSYFPKSVRSNPLDCRASMHPLSPTDAASSAAIQIEIPVMKPMIVAVQIKHQMEVDLDFLSPPEVAAEIVECLDVLATRANMNTTLNATTNINVTPIQQPTSTFDVKMGKTNPIMSRILSPLKEEWSGKVEMSCK